MNEGMETPSTAGITSKGFTHVVVMAVVEYMFEGSSAEYISRQITSHPSKTEAHVFQYLPRQGDPDCPVRRKVQTSKQNIQLELRLLQRITSPGTRNLMSVPHLSVR